MMYEGGGESAWKAAGDVDADAMSPPSDSAVREAAASPSHSPNRLGAVFGMVGLCGRLAAAGRALGMELAEADGDGDDDADAMSPPSDSAIRGAAASSSHSPNRLELVFGMVGLIGRLAAAGRALGMELADGRH